MSANEVNRYLELTGRRLFIVMHSGVDWKPEYGSELEAIDKELAELRVLVDQAHEQKAAAVGQHQEASEGESTAAQSNEQETSAETMRGGMGKFRVRFWHEDEDGREDFLEFATMKQAAEFYHSLDGMAELQEWNEKWKRWWTVWGPEFEV